MVSATALRKTLAGFTPPAAPKTATTGAAVPAPGAEKTELPAPACLLYTSWNIDMEGECIQQIALPRYDGAVACKLEAGEIGDGTFGPVLAGDPLWIVESEWLSLIHI